jgi:hypothetical protein
MTAVSDEGLAGKLGHTYILILTTTGSHKRWKESSVLLGRVTKRIAGSDDTMGYYGNYSMTTLCVSASRRPQSMPVNYARKNSARIAPTKLNRAA